MALQNNGGGDDMKSRRQASYTVPIHPNDLPLERRYTEKPSRVPSFGVDVLAVTVLYTMLVYVTTWGYQENYYPAFLAGAVGLVVTTWRVKWYLGDPFPVIEELEYQAVLLSLEDGSTEPRLIPRNRNGGHHDDLVIRNSKILEGATGAYEFTGRQLERMADWLDRGYTAVRRDTSAEGPGFAELGIRAANYSIVLELLKEAGYVGQDSKWTRTGETWLREI